MFMTRTIAIVGILLSGFFTITNGARANGPDDAQKLAFFEAKIRPMLISHCYACHSAETKPAGGLRVDDRNGLLTGGNTGPAIVPGDPKSGQLLKRVVSSAGKRRMPSEGDHLTDSQIADLTRWIAEGAVWPQVKASANLGKLKPEIDALKQTHWAWQPLQNPKIPVPTQRNWVRDPVDAFVLAKLEAAKLAPVGDASKSALLRRVTFDLTGLPPTLAELDAFERDTSPAAFEKVVDRLLASPRFGEHWGRHWLDLARFGESTGPSRNIPYPHAWRYRDYIIDAFNRDIPYNRLITEQIAGDLLPASNSDERDRLATATGFLALGVKDVNQRFKVRFVMDNVDEQIDVVTRSILGLTVSCARCHDHKFDPIPQTDYYALAGIFTSTDNCSGVRNKMGGGGLDYYDPAMLVTLKSTLPPVNTKEVEALKLKVAEAKKAWDSIRGTPEGLKPMANGQPTQRPFRLKYEKLQGELLALTDPASRGFAVHGVRDAAVIADTEVRLRGEAEKLGPVVPRGFLTAFAVPETKLPGKDQSGRLELAQWLTNPQNPLTHRVIVNRVWAHLFGQGIVSTVDNFGVTGDRPSHPELLDHLAQRFVSEGHSIKRLIRTLVLTRTYQLSSDATAANRAKDPANRLLWRHAPRRLTAEEFRDTTLAIAESLRRNRPEASPAKNLKMIEMRDNGPEAATIHTQANASIHRSVYLPLLRGVTPQSLEAFDPVDQTLVSGRRDATTVPSQSLFVLNSAFIRKQASSAAQKILSESNRSDQERIAIVYRRVLNREPSADEVKRSLQFLGEFESLARLELASAATAKPEVKPTTPSPAKSMAKSGTSKPAAEVIDPDQVDQTGEEVAVEKIAVNDARHAAWLAWIQALFGTAEFRFVP
ncbi:PSD1 and planctomycete cytochrome C domain-containing protein [Tuwongella immobilis]|uniref:Cytochrome c domain-containing protein n=1 Tax=Tuwongella immobilis TaxID=692036 RepID=A0A6C2YNR5_9BACT|nr:PSD1 and planctomycete cytochrome C domain-containing protein [Tuwongella immobilis]VIP02931.1 secreted protein containing duf1549 : Uncharacterized protein OS=Pirellula staleyi (strain ATCC 27377 / DSM 6068 / ICPB 4128) GN=Psta_0318 PE=4 SV=1: PSCyt1: PSCyt2: PSD1 [Tuwongella immobilis]VTS02881.1 secreted protein containing duf1549 : Uncharacterized protein OS=Pirellula staleyi (strain ATCC 27377 / DSM 6068 / ICPB 4128) GN=Psta_0318 PE=4 SV=1: PSCyt1: PSCyt2: PSD1 [Tuwongella immobilis]